jgi:parallel beta-helix repeat protein
MRRLLILALYFIFWILAVISVLTAYIPNAIAEEVHVYPGESIQGSINAASDGDVIIVHQGTYVEHVDFLGKAITVRSTNPNDLEIVHATVIDGNSAGNAVIFSNEEGTDSILSGITVRNGRADYEIDYPVIYPYSGFVSGGIYCDSSSPTISNCIIIDNTGSGIYCDSSSPIIANCTISDNMASYGGVAAIYCNSSSPTITNCSINGNSSSGIYCYSSSPTVINSVIFGNAGDGINFYVTAQYPMVTKEYDACK